MTATALATLLLGLAPTSVTAADLPDGCEATPDSPSCDFACRMGTVIEMVVYGPGEMEPDGRSWISMQTTCGGAGPVASTGYVSTKQIWCEVADDPFDPAWDAVQPECTSHFVSPLDGAGTCRLDTGSRATCRPILPP